MNDNAPESERWVPAKFEPSLSGPSTVQGPDKLGSEFFAESAKNDGAALPKPLPDQSYLAAIFRYDPETGCLFWQERPDEMFSAPRAARAWNARFAGKRALCALTDGGYQAGTIFGERYFAHRVVWKLLHGSDPAIIDHLNGDRSDNRPSNLSSGSASDNLRNQARSRTNTSGVTGVYWNIPAQKWLAQIRVDGKSHTKAFASLEDAAAWRTDMAIQRGFSARHGAEGTAYCSPALDRARRDAEAVIAKAFSREADTLPPPHRMPSQSTEPGD